MTINLQLCMLLVGVLLEEFLVDFVLFKRLRLERSGLVDLLYI